MTPDQLARVERHVGVLAGSVGVLRRMATFDPLGGYEREAEDRQLLVDSYRALLREREALRAALADTVEVIGWLADQQAMPDDSWMPARDAARVLLTGTTARTEGK